MAGPDVAFHVIGRYPSCAISSCSRILLNEPVVKLRLRSEPSVPPSPAVAPSAETTPASPPGILTVTLVFCIQPTAGVKTAVFPCTAQCPAIDGDRVGIGEFGASGWENRTRTELVPLTPLAPAAGVTEIICRAVAGCSGLAPLIAFAGPSDDTSDAWLPGDANATIITPAPRTSAAPLAVRAAPRRLGQVTLNDFQGFLAAELSLPADNDCCLRNHPDPDTVPSPHAISQCDKNSGLNPGCMHNKMTTPPTHRRADAGKGCRRQIRPARHRRRTVPSLRGVAASSQMNPYRPQADRLSHQLT